MWSAFHSTLNIFSSFTVQQIPEKFVQKYGDTLSNMVILKLPCGLQVWLEKGWPEFSKYYSLEHGSMVVFGYEGNFNFNSRIFDRSTVLINYPTKY